MILVKWLGVLSFMALSIVSIDYQASKGILFPRKILLPAQVELQLHSVDDNTNSCLAPTTPEDSATCDAIEAHILDSTVRFQIDNWVVKPDESGYMIDSSIGHGTVKDGRYLVTHNHFSEPFSDNPDIDQQIVYSYFQIFDVNGTKLIGLPGNDVSIVAQDEETLVLDFKERDNVGFFKALGLASAEFIEWPLLDLETNAEIAQVDWDGTIARVDWTTIQEVNVKDTVTRLVMSDGLLVGASGGGVFLRGFHIGNNWTTIEELDTLGVVVGQYSTAALNSNRVTKMEPGLDTKHEDSSLVTDRARWGSIAGAEVTRPTTPLRSDVQEQQGMVAESLAPANFTRSSGSGVIREGHLAHS
jgi:hypothetical protein